MTRHIALLRGINLGPRRRVAMAELRELLASLGYADVRTHLQSGNVLLTSDESADQLRQRMEREIEAALGVPTEVVVRDRGELAEVVARNPLAEFAHDPKRLQVSFLSAAPDPAVVADINARDLAPERVAAVGREIYTWHPEGIQRSQLAGLISDKRLGVTATARNWNTVTKLLELAGEEPAAPRGGRSRGPTGRSQPWRA